MTPMLEPYTVLIILYWLLMIPIAAYVLYLVTGYFTGEYPTSFVRAMFTVVFVAAVVFFSYDGAGYLFFRMMQDPISECAIRLLPCVLIVSPGGWASAGPPVPIGCPPFWQCVLAMIWQCGGGDANPCGCPLCAPAGANFATWP